MWNEIGIIWNKYTELYYSKVISIYILIFAFMNILWIKHYHKYFKDSKIVTKKGELIQGFTADNQQR